VDGDKPIGFCSVGPSRDDDASDVTGELETVYVLPKSQRSGIGTALVQRGLGSLAKAGYYRATLWVLARNEAAQQFYERLGWHRDGRAKTDVWQDVPFVEIRYEIEIRTSADHS
jgi:ribosomal protein S18 acetylase RimI-like enzyme